MRRDREPERPLAEEDLKILATPDKQLEEQTQEYCFDEEQMAELFEGTDRWILLVHANIYLEHIVSQMLTEAMPNPKAIDIERMSISQKTDMANALGVLPGQFAPVIKKIARIRNRVVHKLNFKVTKRDEDDVINLLPAGVRKSIDETRGDSPRFGTSLSAVIYLCDIFRQQADYDRLRLRKATVRLRTVLERTPGAVYKK